MSHAISPRDSGLARQHRPRDRRAQARFDEGLHDRRQHQQAPSSTRGGWTTRKLVYPAYEKFLKGRAQECLCPQGPVPARGREAVPHLLEYFRCPRCRQRPPRTAAAQLHHLSRRYRFAGGGSARTPGRNSSAPGDRMGHRPRRHPAKSGQERLCPSRPAVRTEHDRRSAGVRRDDGQLIKAGADHVCWAPTRSGPARRSGRSRRCAARDPSRCRRSTALRRWAGRRAVKHAPCSAQQRAAVSYKPGAARARFPPTSCRATRRCTPNRAPGGPTWLRIRPARSRVSG